MKNSQSYTINDSTLQQQKYNSLAASFSQLKSQYQQWLSTVIADYSLNDTSTKIKFKPDLAASLCSLFSTQISCFVDSQHRISRSHCLYLSKGIQKLSEMQFLNHVQSILKLRRLVSEKKGVLIQNRQKLSSIEKAIVSEDKESQYSDKPKDHYLTKTWNHRKILLKDYLSCFTNTENQTQIDYLVKLSEQFEKFVLSLRKKTIKYRLDFIKDIAKVTRSFFQCVGELITLGVNQLEHMHTVLRNSMNRMSGEQKSGVKNTTSKTENYLEKIQDNITEITVYKQSLTRLKDLYSIQQTEIEKRHPKIPDHINKQEGFNKLFEGNEHVYAEINKVTKILQFFVATKQQLINQINKIIQLLNSRLQLLNQKLQIIKTINQQSSKKKIFLKQSRSPEKEAVINDEQDLCGDLSNIMNQFLELMIKLYNGLGQKCLMLFKNSRKQKNSQRHSFMELSSCFQEISVNQIKPVVSQFWLWKDYRDFSFFDSVRMRPQFKLEDINNRLAIIQQMIQHERQPGSRYDGSISQGKTHKYKIILYLHPNEVHIFGRRKGLDYIIPRQSLIYAQRIKQKIIIKTKNGAKFIIGSFRNGVIEEMQTAIKENYLDQKLSNHEDDPIKEVQRIKLTDEQIKAIDERKEKIKQQLPSLDGYNKYAESVIQTDMQTLFEAVFSQSDSFILNKSYSSFFEYLHLKKLKNLNFKTTKYEPPGPGYFTGPQNSGVNFANCPTYSSKQFEMDHPLPPVPFIPKMCHCVIKQKLYWISHEELLYFSESKQTQPPITSHFMTYTVYSIKQIDEMKVKFQIYGNIGFDEQARMKSVFKSAGENQMKELNPIVLHQIENSIKMYGKMLERRKNQSGGKQTNDLFEQIQGESHHDSGMSSQKDKTKLYIIAGITLTIIINFLIHIVLK